MTVRPTSPRRLLERPGSALPLSWDEALEILDQTAPYGGVE